MLSTWNFQINKSVFKNYFKQRIFDKCFTLFFLYIFRCFFHVMNSYFRGLTLFKSIYEVFWVVSYFSPHSNFLPVATSTINVLTWSSFSITTICSKDVPCYFRRVESHLFSTYSFGKNLFPFRSEFFFQRTAICRTHPCGVPLY